MISFTRDMQIMSNLGYELCNYARTKMQYDYLIKFSA